jgi:putative ABC transport system ATP-binding protein
VAVPLFAFEGVGLERDGTRVLADVDVAVPAEGITVFVGPSGAGKSTLLRCCNRLEVPTAGRVLYRGDDLATLDPLAHRRRAAMVFQAPARFPGTVADNLRAVATDLSAEEAGELLGRVGLSPTLLDRQADALSGGEAQRMVLARALTTRPEVLLADEPTSALDTAATHRLEQLARSLAADGMPVLWVTHDLDQVRRLADHLVVLDRGRVTWAGPAADPGAAAVLDAMAALDGDDRCDEDDR